MRIDIASRADVTEVAMNARERDVNEFCAVNFFDDRQALAKTLAGRWTPTSEWICGYLDERPVALGMVYESRPYVITLGFLATDDFPKVAMELTRFIKQRLFTRLKHAGVHRIEAVSMEVYEEAGRWLEALGLEREGRMPGFGKKGEAFVQYAWVDPECLSA